MSDTAYPPSINDVSAKLGSANVALQLVTQELVSLQQQVAPGGGTAAGPALATTGTPAPATSSGTLGSATTAARADHAHPTDITRAAAANALGSFSTTGSITTFKNADGSTAGTLVVSAAGTGTVTAPANAPILFTDVNGVVKAGTLSANSSGSTVTITNPNGLQVAQFQVQPGAPGAPGATPALSIGSVSAGSTASASISGSAATPSLNLVLPQGPQGATPSISIGTVTSGTSSAATITGSAAAPVLNLVLQPGPPGQGTQGVPGNTGSAAGGDVGTNLVTSLVGGKSIQLATVLRRTLHSDDFGSQHNGTTIQQATGLTTRSAVAAWVNAYGSSPYAFFANYPVSTGDDIEVYAPTPTTSGNTLVLARSVTLPAAASGYTGPTGLYKSAADGHWYLYVAGTPWADWQPGMFAIFPGLASGTKVLATQGNCVRITDQPAGTTVAAGVVGTIGANMAALKAGQQVWAAQGIQPFTLINSVQATTVILSKAVDTSSTDSYARAIAGVFALQPIRVFTPMAEASICSTMTIDSLAAPATWFNQRQDDASSEGAILSRGDHVINVPIYLWRHSGGLRGCGMYDTFLRSQCNGFALISIFPTRATSARYGDFSFRPYSGAQQAGLYVEGSSEDQPIQNGQNTGLHKPDIRHMTGQCSGASLGPAQLIRMRHCGGVFLEDISHTGTGLDPSPAASCAISAGNVVAIHCKRVGGNYCQAAFLGEGYLEHVIMEDCSTDPTGYVLDLDMVSTLFSSGVGCLICEIRGGDIDIFYAGYRIVLATSVTFNGTEIQAPETPRAMTYGLNTAAVIALHGCYGGTIAALNGGTGSASYDAIQLNTFNLDGQARGTTGMLIGLINASGFAAAVRVQPGCNGNFFDDRTIILNGGISGALVDGGSNLHASSVFAAANKITVCYANGPSISTSSAAIPLVAYRDAAGYLPASGPLVLTSPGWYAISGHFDTADVGSGTGAPQSGYQFGLSLVGSKSGQIGDIQWSTVGALKGTLSLSGLFQVQANETVSLYGVGAQGSVQCNNGLFTVEYKPNV